MSLWFPPYNVVTTYLSSLNLYLKPLYLIQSAHVLLLFLTESTILYMVYEATVKLVHKEHSSEPENVPFINSFPL